MTNSGRSSKDDLALWKEVISPQERIHHELLFYSQGPVDGYLSGERARDVFLHSRLPLTVLSQIWNLADVSNDNILNVEEFVVAMHLILGVKEGLPIPRGLPKHLVPTVTPSPQIGEVTQQEREAYHNVFNKMSQEQIDAIQGRLLLLESQLSKEELSHVWDLSDVNRDGQLDKQEWTVTCHLIRTLKQGCKLDGPINVFKFIPQRLSPASYQARKHRVEEYNKKKHELMTAKEKRKTQIDNETRRLELLRKRLALHKELYECSKTSGEVSVAEKEYKLYKETEENNIEKTEAIVFRLKKEHEKIRQVTVKAILGEQGSLQEDARLLKLEQDDIKHALSTCHTRATKEPDPFCNLYEQRKELRKRSTLSEGEEPEVHFPFTTNPFDKATLYPCYRGDTIFVTPDPSVVNNNNSHKASAILQDLCEFGPGFIEKWKTQDTIDPDYDPIFMSLNISTMDTQGWSGLSWLQKGDNSMDTLHQKLTDLKVEMNKLTEGAGGHLLFRNPEDYLAKRKAQDEEDKLEKSKYTRRHSEKRYESRDKDSAKRRSYIVPQAADEEAARAAREQYRQKRRSLNLDKRPSNTNTAKTVSSDVVNPPQSQKHQKDSETKSSVKSELKVSTSNSDSFTPISASSPRSANTSGSVSPRGTDSGPTSPRSTTSPSRPSTKRKAAPPPPQSTSSSAPVPPRPTSPPSVKPKSPTPDTAPESPPTFVQDTKSPEQPKVSAKKSDITDGSSNKVEVPKSIKSSKVETNSQPTSSKREAPSSPESKLPQPTKNTQEIIPNRPPRRKKSQSEENKSFLHNSFDKEQKRQSKEIAVNVDIKDDEVKISNVKNNVIDQIKADKSLEIRKKGKQNEMTETVPHSNIDDLINESKIEVVKNGKNDAIVKEFPNLKQGESKEIVILTKVQNNLETVPKVNNANEDIIVANVNTSVEAEIKPVRIEKERGKFIKSDTNTTIEFKEPVVTQKSNNLMDSDSDIEIEIVTRANQKPTKEVSFEQDEIDGYIDHIKPSVYKKPENVELAFDRIVHFSQKDKPKDTVSITSDISSTGSEAPPLPDSAPPTLGPLLVEVSEVMESVESGKVEGSPSLSKGEPMSPVSGLPASVFSMRVKSPTRDLVNGHLTVDVGGKRRGSYSDSDMSDEDESQTRVTGIFTPGEHLTKTVPTETHEDDGGIQLISYNAKLHSPNSDQSGPDSAFEDMQSSMTSNDPLSNTLDDVIQEEYVMSEKVVQVESAPKGEVVSRGAKKFELALDRNSRPRGGEVLSPTGSKDFMAKAHQFSESVQRPPKMTVKLKREILSPEDLTDEHYLELEKERRNVINMSTVKKRDMTPKLEQGDKDSQLEAEPQSSDPECSIQEWRSDVNKRANISWEEKPEKVNLYSENIIQESENTETVDRDSIANLSTTRQQWESKFQNTEPKNTQKPKEQSKQVRHWEVKLPTQLKKVPADIVQANGNNSDSDSENENKMADVEHANESAIEREIRLAMEREEMLRKEQDDRANLQARQNSSPTKPVLKESTEPNNNKPTYHEMTEADRGSELQVREELIQQELQEQQEREAAIRGDRGNQDSGHSSTEEDETANESIIEREIRLQQERERELEQRRGTQNVVEDEEEEEVVETVTVEYYDAIRQSPTPVSTPGMSTPDDLSETEDQSNTTTQEVRSRISYEEAISNANHDGESLIARELREGKEREEELKKQQERTSGSVNIVNQSQKQTASPPSVNVAANTRNSVSDNVKPSYQKDVSPYKTNRRQSQDSLSSHSTEKSQNIIGTNKNPRVTAFGDKRSLNTQNRSEKPKNVKKAETPIEREIRIARERENEYRVAKGLTPLADIKKEEPEVVSDDDSNIDMAVSKSHYFSPPSHKNSDSVQRLASSRLQKEINKQNEIEKKYRQEGKIISTSEDHVGLIKYTEIDSGVSPKRNFNVSRKNGSEPAAHQNGTSESKPSPKLEPEQSPAPKFGRSTSSGGVTFSYKESRHKAESKIEKELREMREREEELRSQRAGAGLVSPRGPDSPRNAESGSVINKRSQFEQTS